MKLKYNPIVRIRSNVKDVGEGQIGMKEQTYNMKTTNLIDCTQKACMSKNYYRKLKILVKEYFIFCQFCDIRKGVFIHHINKNRKDNRLENLMPLCKTCHIVSHTPKKTFYHPFTGYTNLKNFEKTKSFKGFQ